MIGHGEAETTYRGVIQTRRPDDGEPCTLLVRRVNGRVELLFHAALSTAAKLTNEQVGELVEHLIAARKKR